MNNHAQSEYSSVSSILILRSINFLRAEDCGVFGIARIRSRSRDTDLTPCRIHKPIGSRSAAKVESKETTTGALDLDNKTLLRIFVKVTAIAVTVCLIVLPESTFI